MSWAWNWKKGYSFTSTPVVSNADVKKIKGPLGSQEWGPYKKTYTKSIFGQYLFTPPRSVDGIPILCRCRSIRDYMRTTNGGDVVLGAGGAILIGSNPPACWEDSETIYNPGGGHTYKIIIRDPAFYAYAANEGGLAGLLGIGPLISGGKKRQTRRKLQKKSSKVKTYKK
jgi:hypothetical protein